jgi:predicted metal-dependent hydrolase
MEPLKYLAGYPQHMLARVHELIEQGRLGTMLADRYSQAHAVRNDSQLYDYVQALKDRHLRKSVPLGKVIYEQAAGDEARTWHPHRHFPGAGRQAEGQSRNPHRHRVPRRAR